VPKEGSVEDFDFDLSLTTDNMGLSSTGLMVKGSGLYKNKEFDFEGPITIKSQWNLTLQNSSIPMEFNYNEL
jgi:hypothetical protein